jgi:hypothetical protein
VQNKVKQLILFISLILLALLITTCQVPGQLGTSINGGQVLNKPDSDPPNKDTIKLGAAYRNPFSVKARGEGAAANAYYARLKTADVPLLQEFLDHYPDASRFPLDREITEGGLWLDADTTTSWFYLALPIVEYNDLAARGMTGEILDELVFDPSTPEAPVVSGDKAIAQPSGYIQVYNTITGNFEPVPHVKVVVTQWFNSQSTYTDSSGHFTINYPGKVRRHIDCG